MTWSYTAGASDLDVCRMLVLDTDIAHPIFSNEEITAYLNLEGGDVRYAAAVALEGRASEQALVLRITEILSPGLKVDGVSGAKAVMAYAASLRQQADNQGADFDVAEQVLTPGGYAQRVWNQRLRGVG